MIGQICKTCYYFVADNYRCNMLVHTQIGMRDRIGSDYCKGYDCPYYHKGNNSINRGSKPVFYNS